MSKCPKCGAEYTDEAVCPSCGEQTEVIETEVYDAKDVEDNKIYSILSYLGFLVLVPIFAAQDSPFARFHANQGLVLLIAELIAAVISTVLWFIPVAGLVLSLVIGLPLYLITVVFMVMGIINAYQGKAKELPLIGRFNILK